MLRKGLRIIFLLVTSLSIDASNLFTVNDSGDVAAVTLKFCLNAEIEKSCEIHSLSKKDFSVTTNIPNKTYTKAGFLPLSPGFNSSDSNVCELLDNGFCKFSVDNSTPKTFALNKPIIITDSGTYIFPDGTKIYSNTRVLGSLTSGRAKIKLIAEGGPAGQNIGLEAKVYKINAPERSITLNFSNPSLSSGTFNFTDLIANYQNTGPGTYTIEIRAANKPGKPLIATIQITINIPLPPGPTPTPANEIRASYLDVTAVGSLSQISDVGIQASNMILFAFFDPKCEIANQAAATPTCVGGVGSPPPMSTIQSIIKRENTDGTTLNFLSLGGAYGTRAGFPATAAASVNNIVSQINYINSNLSSGKISGVDLDLEGADFDANFIKDLAEGFQNKGLYVSIAPQVYLNSGSNIDPNTPNNLILTSAGTNNAYYLAVQNDLVDYILLQTYNTGGFTIGGVDESSVQFFTKVSQAMNNLVQANCSSGRSGYQVCIPEGTEIVIGEPSNAGAAGPSVNNIFGVAVGTAYNQTTVLNDLKTQWRDVKLSYPNVSGIFQWSLNNDYAPSMYGDTYALAGNFSKIIFEAGGPTPPPPGPTPPPPGPTPPPTPPPTPTSSQFILSVINSGDSTRPTSVTLISGGQYYAFAGYSNVLSPKQSALWGNAVAASANSAIRDSWALDALFSNANSSFSTSQILINGYSSGNDTLANAPISQAVCYGQYTFELGHSYQITILSAATSSCIIEKVA